MFFTEENAGEQPPLASSLGLRVALGLTGVLTLAMGIYPEPFLQMAQKSLFK
jgi:NADH-quinone oxidoreductase subunit N